MVERDNQKFLTKRLFVPQKENDRSFTEAKRPDGRREGNKIHAHLLVKLDDSDNYNCQLVTNLLGLLEDL
ncbi:CNT_collapsed_G0015740.mRNA.1.CDS.1 [Saccharomyces cerevisiae]|nr:CNT_collapsed_G0015740.mRNA.1.CDS.1 [Saccharomyces cerevisiae]